MLNSKSGYLPMRSGVDQKEERGANLTFRFINHLIKNSFFSLKY